jgi:hypothetical protein
VNFDAIVLLRGGNLIQNGSFEDGTSGFVNTTPEPLISGVKIICGNSRTLPHWGVARRGATRQDCTQPNTLGNPDDGYDAVNWFNSSNSSTITANDGAGVMFIDLTGFNHRPPSGYGVIEQSVQTSPGSDYVLFFLIGSTNVITNKGRVGIQVDALDSKTPETPLKSLCGAITEPSEGCRFDAEYPATSLSDWRSKTMRFTAAGTDTTIRFAGVGDDPGLDYIGLDKVELYCAGHKVLMQNQTQRVLYYFADC